MHIVLSFSSMGSCVAQSTRGYFFRDKSLTLLGRLWGLESHITAFGTPACPFALGAQRAPKEHMGPKSGRRSGKSRRTLNSWMIKSWHGVCCILCYQLEAWTELKCWVVNSLVKIQCHYFPTTIGIFNDYDRDPPHYVQWTALDSSIFWISNTRSLFTPSPAIKCWKIC